MTPRRVAVTGAGGMIGLEVCRQLADAGHEVQAIDLGEQVHRTGLLLDDRVKIFSSSILDQASLHPALDGSEILIHLAALLGVQRSETQRLRCIGVNVDGTRAVLEAAVMAGVSKVVFSSSSEVYGEPLENPVEETSITQGRTLYAITKLMGEELCQAFGDSYGLRYTVLRLFNTYGPYQARAFVMSRFIHAVMAGESPVVYGVGDQIRSFTYVSDVARAVIASAFADEADGETLNIGTGRNRISMIDLARLVIDISGRKGTIEPQVLGTFDNSDRKESREIFARVCSGERAKQVLGWSAEINLAEGIQKVFDCGILMEEWPEANMPTSD